MKNAILITSIFLNAFFATSIIMETTKSKVVFRSPIVVETELLSPIPQGEASSAEVIVRSIEGQASYYSRAGCLGCSETLTMANGQSLDDSALTIALSTKMVRQYQLLNETVEVQNMVSGEKVRAKVTDTGGFDRYGRIADLTIATRDALNCPNLCQVRINY